MTALRSSSQPVSRRRPRGVAVLAVLLVLVGALLGPGGFFLGASLVAGGNYLGGLLFILAPQAFIFGGLGLWFLKPWGVYLTVGAFLYVAFRTAQDVLVDATQTNLLRLGIALVVAGLVFWYLTRPHVKDAVRGRAAGA